MMGVIEVLVDLGANCKATNNEGKTPYDIAKEEGQREVAKYLKKLTKSN